MLIRPSLLLILSPGLTFASPLYYTFQGLLDYTYGPEASGVIPWQPVTYVFAVDRMEDGYLTDINGNVTPRIDSDQYDYYFADLFYASFESPGSRQPFVGERNYGRDKLSRFDFPEPTDLFTLNETQLHLAYDNLLDLQIAQVLSPESWIDVDWTNAGHRFGDGGDLSYFAVHGLQLTAVSATAPAPAPAAVWLLGSALTVLSAARRRSR